MSVTDETGKSRRLSQVNNVTLPESERKRREAVWELFHSEVVYLTAHLLVLKEVYIIVYLSPISTHVFHQQKNSATCSLTPLTKGRKDAGNSDWRARTNFFSGE